MDQLTLEEATRVKLNSFKVEIIKKTIVFVILLLFLLASIFTHIFIEIGHYDTKNQTITANFTANSG